MAAKLKDNFQTFLKRTKIKKRDKKEERPALEVYNSKQVEIHITAPSTENSPNLSEKNVPKLPKKPKASRSPSPFRKMLSYITKSPKPAIKTVTFQENGPLDTADSDGELLDDDAHFSASKFNTYPPGSPKHRSRFVERRGRDRTRKPRVLLSKLFKRGKHEETLPEAQAQQPVEDSLIVYDGPSPEIDLIQTEPHLLHHVDIPEIAYEVAATVSVAIATPDVAPIAEAEVDLSVAAEGIVDESSEAPQADSVLSEPKTASPSEPKSPENQDQTPSEQIDTKDSSVKKPESASVVEKIEKFDAIVALHAKSVQLQSPKTKCLTVEPIASAENNKASTKFAENGKNKKSAEKVSGGRSSLIITLSSIGVCIAILAILTAVFILQGKKIK